MVSFVDGVSLRRAKTCFLASATCLIVSVDSQVNERQAAICIALVGHLAYGSSRIRTHTAPAFTSELVRSLRDAGAVATLTSLLEAVDLTYPLASSIIHTLLQILALLTKQLPTFKASRGPARSDGAAANRPLALTDTGGYIAGLAEGATAAAGASNTGITGVGNTGITGTGVGITGITGTGVCNTGITVTGAGGPEVVAGGGANAGTSASGANGAGVNGAGLPIGAEAGGVAGPRGAVIGAAQTPGVRGSGSRRGGEDSNAAGACFVCM